MRKRIMNKRNGPVMTGILISVLLFALSGCTGDKQGQQIQKPPAPVLVEESVMKSVPVQLTAIGTVEPYSQVQIKSRVGGELIRVSFREGQDVRKGDLLFTIDPRPYESALQAAEANLERDLALAKKAKEDVNRYTELVRDELVSKSQYEQVFASSKALDATVAADKAAVENARLNLSYCFIYAPVAGRTGSLLVDVGNQIKANDDNKAMVVINQIQPIYVTFSVPEKALPEIRRYLAREALKIEAKIKGEEDRPLYGLVQFIDNTVDTATGMIKLKGVFPNKDSRLWPGQFVSVTLTLAVQDNAVLVPASALLTGQQGQFVYVVKEDSTAEMRPVTAGRPFQSLVVIDKGLKAGEKVITDGQMRVMPGSRVEIKSAQGAGGGEQVPKPGFPTDKPAVTQKEKAK